MTRKEIENYISTNYNNLLNTAKYITKNSNDAAGDVLNDILLSLLDRKDYTDRMKNCYNIYNYVYAALRNQFYSSTSKYNKYYRNNLNFEFELDYLEDVVDDYDYTFEGLLEYVENKSFFNDAMLNEIYHNPEGEKYIRNKYILRNHIEKKFFLEYFYQEVHNKDLDRRITYKLLSEKYGIALSTAYSYVRNIVDELRVDTRLEKMLKNI